MLKIVRLPLVAAAFLIVADVSGSGSLISAPPLDRSRLPAALSDVPLTKLSSGALQRLDRDGDLVQAPARAQNGATPSDAVAAAAAISLDRRVGRNIRLGDDPAALPANQRAQAEPHIARSSADLDFLVATFQEGRFTNGGAIDCGFSITRDGGLNWSRALLPNLTQATGGPYYRVTDPVAAVDLDNNGYINTIAATDPNFNTGVVLVSRSFDGGQTFGSPVTVYQPPSSSGLFADKNWMAVNTFAGTATAGRIVVTFTLFQSNGRSPIARSYSDDHGNSWSSIAYVNPVTSDTQGSQPVFLPNNRLAIVYWNFGANRSPGGTDDVMQVVISDDGGVTYGAPKLVTPVSLYAEPAIRSGGFLPSAATDRIPGHLYVAYQALRNGSPRILFTKSTDAGNTWTSPIVISDNPSGSGVFNPAIAAAPDGRTLTASFYDHRDHPGSNILVDQYLAQSFDGGATWQPNIRVSSVSTDASLAPLTGSGYMLGDYLGIAEPTTQDVPAVPIWVDTRTGNPDPFIARVGIAPVLDFTSWQAARLSLGEIHDPQLGGEAGDADQDGEDNLSEFRSDTDPQDPLSVVHSGQQLNISTRAFVAPGDNALIGGFIITGTKAKKVIIRALGPSLGQQRIADALQDPTLELRGQDGSTIADNDDWRIPDSSGIEATGLAPTDDRESAIVRILAPGSYTAVVRGKDNSSGIALVEVYDLAPAADSRLANISSRGLVQTDDNVMIGGLIIGAGQGVDGAGSARILLRAIGPSLEQSGVTGALQNPELELVDANGTAITSNDDWKQTQQAAITATGIAPTDDREAAAIALLGQGSYTILVRGRARTNGIALVEAYNLP